MNNGNGEISGELARRKLDGASYTELRKELEEKGYTSGEISALIREADEKVLRETVSGSRKPREQAVYRTGLFLAVAGLLISIAYNAGIILSNLPSLAVYTPFLAGILLMVYARFTQHRRKVPPKSGRGSIRRRRPYK